MNNSRSKRIPKIILGQSLVLLVILIISSYLIIYSLGYKVNLQSRKIIKTGIIALSISQMPDKILLDGKEQSVRQNKSFQLQPGYYDVEVQKNGYDTWKTRSNVEAEIVNYFKYIVLIKANPEISTLADQSKIDKLLLPDTSLAENAPKGLSYNGFEIWLGDRLVTRFSEQINNVIWYPDYHHLVFQKGSRIQIIEDTGANEATLAILSSDIESKFAIGGRSQELYFVDNGSYKVARIL